MCIRDRKYDTLPLGYDAITKIRYKNAGTESVLFLEDKDLMRIEFEHNVSAITPGQSAVFYEGNDVIGGGHILSSFRSEN